MEINALVQKLIVDTVGTETSLGSIHYFLPELILCGTILLMLLVRVFKYGDRIDSFWLALAGSAAALYFVHPRVFMMPDATFERHEFFTGMLVHDQFSVFIRALLLFFLILFAIFTKLTGMPDRENAADFYSLVLGGVVGMCLMASANHLLMVFLAVEMASVPSYVLAGVIKRNRKASEAALKYAVYGAGAAGVMLYGISLLAGVLNTAHLPTVALKLAELYPTFSTEQLMVLALGGLMLMVGLAFKLSAVPFHFWCPDVFEGATAEVNAFLSVASKAAAVALLVRVVVGFGAVPLDAIETRDVQENIAAAAPDDRENHFHLASAVAAQEDEAENSTAENPEVEAIEADPETAPEQRGSELDQAKRTLQAEAIASLGPARNFMAMLVAFIAIITCTFGNLAAYGQTNIKRLMAYSTIAHAGYMLMAIPAALALIGVNNAGASDAFAAVGIYLGVYLFMNLGVFAAVAFLRNALGSEEIADYAGLMRRAPGTVICVGVLMFSLVGLPPLAGFIGKFAIFAALADAYRSTGFNYLMLLLIGGGVNTALSLFYYLRVVKVMALDPEPEDRPPVVFPLASLQGAFLVAITMPMILLFLNWNGLSEWTRAAANQLFM